MTARRGQLGFTEMALIAVSGGIVGYIAISYLLQVAHWPISDANAYWDAAVRLREGQALYVATGPESSDLYRYAPWFAYLWVPLTFLPHDAVFVAWSGLLLVATVIVVAPIASLRTPAAILTALLGGSFLVWTAGHGNVQPLIILALSRTLERQSGPVWVGIAASLKLAPIAYVLVWIGRRDWRSAAVCLLTTAVLVGPMLLFNVSDYTTDAGARPAIIPWLPAQVVAVVIAGALTLATARTRWAWLNATITAMLVLPRFVEYSVTFALVGFAQAAPGRTAYGDEKHRVLASRRADTPV